MTATKTRTERRRQQRLLASSEAAKQKHAAKKNSRRALLQRQTRREKAGFYEGLRPVAQCITPSRSRIAKRRVKKGAAFGRIILTIIADGRERMLHATKGWRGLAA